MLPKKKKILMSNPLDKPAVLSIKTFVFQ